MDWQGVADYAEVSWFSVSVCGESISHGPSEVNVKRNTDMKQLTLDVVMQAILEGLTGSRSVIASVNLIALLKSIS